MDGGHGKNQGTGKIQGTVLEIQRMSTEDGPGIRTTVFMKGCPLACAWCHNPESIRREPQVHWIGARCIGCRICVVTCGRKALTFVDGAIVIDRAACNGCGECAQACPSTAMEQLGHRWDAAKLAAEVLKDRAYFESSGGGVTLSGGEPTVQAAFSAEFLEHIKDAGVHTALDTCGLCRREDLALLLPLADLVLFDLKLMDPAEHKKHTGASNERILENLKFIAETMRQNGQPAALWVRTPIIPGATDDDATITAIGRFIADNLADVVSRWDLCTFNNLCRDKYARLGLVWEYCEARPLKREQIEHLAAVARASGVNPATVQFSGATRLEENQENQGVTL